MKLFDKLIGKNKDDILAAPMKGKCIALKNVPDALFSEGQLGKGVAIIPSDGHVYAPADGIVTMVFPTGHAVGIKTKSGAEILLHIGLDTVELNGEPFIIKVKNGQKVRKGDLLIIADIQQIREAGKNVVTPLIICNSNDYSMIEEKIDTDVEVGDLVLKYTK